MELNIDSRKKEEYRNKSNIVSSFEIILHSRSPFSSSCFHEIARVWPNWAPFLLHFHHKIALIGGHQFLSRANSRSFISFGNTIFNKKLTVVDRYFSNISLKNWKITTTMSWDLKKYCKYHEYFFFFLKSENYIYGGILCGKLLWKLGIFNRDLQALVSLFRIYSRIYSLYKFLFGMQISRIWPIYHISRYINTGVFQQILLVCPDRENARKF